MRAHSFVLDFMAQTEAGGMGLSGIRKLISQLVSSVRCGLEKLLAVQVWWPKTWKNQTRVRFKSDAKGGFLISGLPFASAGAVGNGGVLQEGDRNTVFRLWSKTEEKPGARRMFMV